jgi:hypothetical protein
MIFLNLLASVFGNFYKFKFTCMTLQQFRLLSKVEQDEHVTNHGIFLINYIDGDSMCDVYKLYEFYVKFCYDVNDDKDPEITIFASDKFFKLPRE